MNFVNPDLKKVSKYTLRLKKSIFNNNKKKINEYYDHFKYHIQLGGIVEQDIQKKIQSFENHILKISEKINDLKSFDTINEELSTSNTEKSLLESKNTELEKKINELNEKLNESVKSIESVNTSKDKEISDLNTQIESLNSQIKDLENKLNQLNNDDNIELSKRLLTELFLSTYLLIFSSLIAKGVVWYILFGFVVGNVPSRTSICFLLFILISFLSIVL